MLMITFQNIFLNVTPDFLGVVSVTCVFLYNEEEIKISHVVKANSSQHKLQVKNNVLNQ